MEKRGKSVEAAVEEALRELNASKDEVEIEVIDEGSKGFLGIGAKDAVVRVTLKGAEPAAEKPAPAKAAPAAKAEPAYEDGADIFDGEAESADPAETAKKFLEDIFGAMNLDVSIAARLEGDTVKINLEGDNMGIVIGKRGDTLDSLQYLASLVVNRRSGEYIKISIDTENYREKREDALLALSDRLAAKVEKSGRKFTLEPMNPYERRIIHSNLQDNPAVTTYSIGQEPYRKVVIAPKNPKSLSRKSGSRGGRKPRRGGSDKGGYRRAPKNRAAEQKPVQADAAEVTNITAEKKGSYTTTYKADFKPAQHKAQYASFEEYLAAQEEAKKNN